ncbi:hypothetical protein [Botrimarina mediterranea]|uniref:hypothetical protein n=1 Tax=Botrimarina mediterranea TaxID=2528022 RepID=UPI001189BA25|nr:hypothetical protein K2D_25850 [Planctomycetes bacterium K2D]
MATREELNAARLFVEKANRLLKSTFLKEAAVNMGWTLSGKKDEAVRIEHRGPRWENVEAFVLTFRFFIQDNESISIRNMAKVFSSDLATPGERRRFYEIRESLNKYLDGSSMFKEGARTASRREVMDVFIYGGMSHAKPKKKEKFDAWMRHVLLGPMTTTEFTTILSTVLSAIENTQRICVTLLYRYA